MDTSFERIREVFLAAVDQPADRRDAYLDEACAGDTGLREQVEGLLGAHARGGGLLDRGLAGPIPPGTHEALPEGPGTVIGPYKLLQQLGEGGMGTVYLAEQ